MSGAGAYVSAHGCVAYLATAVTNGRTALCSTEVWPFCALQCRHGGVRAEL